MLPQAAKHPGPRGRTPLPKAATRRHRPPQIATRRQASWPSRAGLRCQRPPQAATSRQASWPRNPGNPPKSNPTISVALQIQEGIFVQQQCMSQHELGGAPLHWSATVPAYTHKLNMHCAGETPSNLALIDPKPDSPPKLLHLRRSRLSRRLS